MHDIVFWLQVFSVVPFILACAGAVLLAHGDTRRQARAALFTVANPLLIWAVVAGAHNEALAVMFAVAGLLFMRKNPFVAGIGIGLAGCAKLSIGLWGLAMLWAYRREPKKAAAALPGHGCPDGAGVRASGSRPRSSRCCATVATSRSGPGPIRSIRFFNLFLTELNAKIVVGVISYIGLIVIAWMLSRTVPWTAGPGLAKGADLRRDPLTIALRTALVLSVAWLITSMYTLSWYDLIAWVPMAVLATSKLDRIMLIRGTPLSLAYVPGRAIDLGPALDFTATRMRDTVSPIVQLGVLLAVVLWWRQPDRPELFPFKKSKTPPAAVSPTVSSPPAAPTKAPSPRSSPSKAARSQDPVPVRELASRRRS